MRLSIPLLGSVPIDPAVCVSGDMGKPAILLAPESRQAQVFREIAGKVAARVSTLAHEARERGDV
jgi:ATP-binding protein involved in chromosome partitioning